MARQVAYGEASLHDAEDLLVSRSTGTFLLHRPDRPARLTSARDRRARLRPPSGHRVASNRRRLVPARPKSRPPMVTVSPNPVCCICRAPTRLPFPLCFCCTSVARQLRLPLVPVATVADYRLGDPLHRCLRGYKDAPWPRPAGSMCSVSRPCSAPGWSTIGRCPASAVGGTRWSPCPRRAGRPAPRSMPWSAGSPGWAVGRPPCWSGAPPHRPSGGVAVGFRDRRRDRPRLAPRSPGAGGGRHHHHRGPGPERGGGPPIARRRGHRRPGPRGVVRPRLASTRPGACSSASSPNPSRGPATTTCWPWPRPPSRSASTPSSAATTTWPWGPATGSPDRATPGSPWPASPARRPRSASAPC